MSPEYRKACRANLEQSNRLKWIDLYRNGGCPSSQPTGQLSGFQDRESVKMSPEHRKSCARFNRTARPGRPGGPGLRSRPIILGSCRRHFLEPDPVEDPPLPRSPLVEVPSPAPFPGRARERLGPGRRRTGLGQRVVECSRPRANRYASATCCGVHSTIFECSPFFLP